MSLDLTPIVQPILAAAGAVITGLLAIYVPKALTAFQERTGVVLTENQRKTVLDAVQTAKGVLETKLDQGALKAAHIEVSDPAVLAQAQAVVNAVPVAAAALNVTVPGVARMIVGAVDTAVHGDAPSPPGLIAVAPIAAVATQQTPPVVTP